MIVGSKWPPILIADCPGSGGHPWARIDPVWYSTTGHHGHGPMWCPDHSEERAKHIRDAIAESHARLRADYQAMPLPATRNCLSPNPVSHERGAVLPAGNFYRSRRQTATGETLSLDSRCKECRRAETNARWHALPPEERERRIRDRTAKDQAARKRGRKDLRNEADSRLALEPFAKWLREFMQETGLTFTEIHLKTGVDESALQKYATRNGRKFIQRSTIDRVSTQMGIVPSLFVQLYDD